jgi:probable rRNA maturation factor
VHGVCYHSTYKVNMPEQRVDVAVALTFRASVSQPWLRRLVLHILDAVSPGQECQVSLALTDDETVRELNLRYRGLDETTDVLSFAPDHPGSWEGHEEVPSGPDDTQPFVLPQNEPQTLGEVVISHPQAERQAQIAGHTLERELAILVIHGVLHLLGYDHHEQEQETQMRDLESRILASASRVEAL